MDNGLHHAAAEGQTLDGLMLGEEAASTIGINTFRCRLVYLLVLSVPARKSLKEFFRSATRTNKNFDITQRPFKLLYTGKGFQWHCAVDVIGSDDTFESEGKDYVFPDSPDLPEPIDVKAYLLDKRAEMDDFISSLRTGSGQAADTSGLDLFAGETRPMPDWAAPFDKEEVAPQAKAEPKGEHKEIDIERYMEMAPARMRSLAAKAGLPATKGMTKVELA